MAVETGESRVGKLRTRKIIKIKINVLEVI